MHNDNNIVSVHEWIQTKQERSEKPNSECGIASALNLGSDKDFKFLTKVQKHPVLPWSLCSDPQWQHHDFSA